VTHEFAHQWGDDFNWSRLAGVTRAGHQPSAHAPLWWSDETMIGAVLTGDRRVRQNGSVFEIERTSTPIRYHTIELYSLGLIGREDVPDVSNLRQPGTVLGDDRQPSREAATSPCPCASHPRKPAGTSSPFFCSGPTRARNLPARYLRRSSSNRLGSP
jgi:hypothetical protein